MGQNVVPDKVGFIPRVPEGTKRHIEGHRSVGPVVPGQGHGGMEQREGFAPHARTPEEQMTGSFAKQGGKVCFRLR
ncbi:hypothetical protein SDC9_113412 [bioreactor metagenome]|uniref:Uncharacterized protein n=1 Tax=bioreactor metagenome TaxID=1076179 RepID=A0A645BXR5_9ZZZZ